MGKSIGKKDKKYRNSLALSDYLRTLMRPTLLQVLITACSTLKYHVYKNERQRRDQLRSNHSNKEMNTLHSSLKILLPFDFILSTFASLRSLALEYVYLLRAMHLNYTKAVCISYSFTHVEYYVCMYKQYLYTFVIFIVI